MDEEINVAASPESDEQKTIVSVDNLTAMAATIIETNRTESHLRPQWVAEQVLKQIDPRRVSLPAVYGGYNLYLRQIARSLLREKFEIKEQNSQHELFPELQWRYPAERAKGQEASYVLLEMMTASDITYNVERLRSEADAKQKHADALEAYGRKRFASLRTVKTPEPAV